jgi:Ca-activated chloride channel family protein
MAAVQTICSILVLSAWGLSLQSQTEQPRNCRDEVLLRVSIFDPLNRCVSGLEKQHFSVLENNVQQAITQFAHRSASLCLGIIYDMTRRTTAGAELPVVAARRLFKSGGPEEEFFIISFDSQKGGLVNWSRGVSDAGRSFDLGQVGGMAPMDEAAHVGVARIRNSTSAKKALVMISDAPEKDIRLAFGAQNITSVSGFQVYFIQQDPSRAVAPSTADSRIPGGTYVINDLTEVEYYLGLIYAELQNQYLIGYIPSNASCDGRWRKISIKLKAPKGMPELRIKAPQGYFAAAAK